jgi:hypothetical protein
MGRAEVDMGLMTHQSKRGYAKSRADKARRNHESAERAKKMEDEIQRRVALELWKVSRMEEEANAR